MSFWQNFIKSLNFAVKLPFSVVSRLNLSKISLKILQNSPPRLLLAWYFPKFQKSTPEIHNFIQLGSVSSKILLKTFQVLLSNTILWVKLRYYCAYMSVFKGQKYEISIIATYFNTFKLKTHSKI